MYGPSIPMYHKIFALRRHTFQRMWLTFHRIISRKLKGNSNLCKLLNAKKIRDEHELPFIRNGRILSNHFWFNCWVNGRGRGYQLTTSIVNGNYSTFGVPVTGSGFNPLRPGPKSCILSMRLERTSKFQKLEFSKSGHYEKYTSWLPLNCDQPAYGYRCTTW